VSLVERLLDIDVSALSEADKTLPVLGLAVQAMIADMRIAGPRSRSSPRTTTCRC
jgi:4-hydroxy-4-methyl-2-oxoglutarate aldolase